MKTIVQISLDITNIPEAIETAQVAIRAGVDWLEVGTPLIIAEGMNGVRALRKEFRDVPFVADLKTMDGGWLEAEMKMNADDYYCEGRQRKDPRSFCPTSPDSALSASPSTVRGILDVDVNNDHHI